MLGRPKKSLAFKVISGTVSSRDRPKPPDVAGDMEMPAVEFPLLVEVPNVPTWMPNSHASKEWKRLGPILVHNRMLTEAGLSAFGHLCALHGKLVQLWASGESPSGHLLSQYRALINDFGLTPVSQGKVKQLAPKGPLPEGADESSNPSSNPFAKNGARTPPTSRSGGSSK